MSQATPMPEKGLCPTCLHAGGCIFSAAATRPVWYCDHYETDLDPAPGKVPLRPARGPKGTRV